jgi:hypothetical protein
MSVDCIEVNMSLQEAVVAAQARAKPKVELTKAERAKRAAKRRKARRILREADRALIAKAQNPNQVLTFRQWCLLAGFSVDTGRRVIKAGKGPIITQLSKRKLGVSLANHVKWEASRARGVA